ncbi:HEAT repeat domain-containing protein [Congregibacter litoralis]|uniref:HEAT repeat protein n=1 Tax=Congregibacter litoralis KT71 TaxID=314285 RepID=A4A8G0_9GAMM|nr:HEAT repeat domain-containing protein [Congregibacter litoralis]EAQ97955.1 HEAT repeat protein [Congregibacter litoralis KT71]
MLFDKMTSNIMSQAFNGLARVLVEKPLEYVVYDLPETWNPEVFDPAFALEEGQAQQALPGEVIIFEGNRRIVDFQSPGCLVLKLLSTPICTKTWAFSRSSRQALQTHEVLSLDSQLLLAITTLGKIGDHESLENLRVLATRHGNHSVRWAAVQAAAAISEDAAIKMLQNALTDAHPHISNAAKRTLELNGL